MEQAVPVVQVVIQQGRRGANVQVAGLCQGEACADGPVIHCSLHTTVALVK